LCRSRHRRRRASEGVGLLGLGLLLDRSEHRLPSRLVDGIERRASDSRELVPNRRIEERAEIVAGRVRRIFDRETRRVVAELLPYVLQLRDQRCGLLLLEELNGEQLEREVLDAEAVPNPPELEEPDGIRHA